MSDYDKERSDSVYSYSYSEIDQGDTETTGRDTAFDGSSGGSYYQYSEPDGSAGGQAAWSPYQEPKRERKKLPPFGGKLLKAAAIALVFGLVAGAAFQVGSLAFGKVLGTDKKTAGAAALTTNEGNLDPTSTSSVTTVTDVSDIVENVMPAVVAVTNISIAEYRSFFGRTQSYESTSCGSGIIISQDQDNIYIATNNHVVSGAETLTITFVDGSAVQAVIKGTDPTTDLAVVSVAVSDIDSATIEKVKVATVGDSSSIVVGEGAVVIGNALGYGQSVTTGCISALDREVQLQDEQGQIISNRLIQTDAAVNPGNSGGALLNMNGEVIGIVSAKYGDTYVEGMGYAIPISSVAAIIEGLISEPVDEKNMAYLGISGIDITPALAEEYQLPQGVYVLRVVSGSGANKAGIEKGDVVTALNGRSVSSMDEIKSIMQYISAGSTIEITVARAEQDYEETTLEVKVGRKVQ